MCYSLIIFQGELYLHGFFDHSRGVVAVESEPRAVCALLYLVIHGGLGGFRPVDVLSHWIIGDVER
ncbi:hypothetical protein CVV72_34370 [Amycolatopsis sp. TNS106]|nr:hypothetical protein CVV72_34370 [Amycolatopsis sp. TNS106]